MLLFLVYFAENFSVNLKTVYIAHRDIEVECDAAIIPQRIRYQTPSPMAGNVCSEPPKTRVICTSTKTGLINLDQVAGDVSQEGETDLEAEPEPQTLPKVGIMSLR